MRLLVLLIILQKAGALSGVFRLDQILVSRGFFDSRAQAKQAIQAGHVKVAGAVVLKAAAAFDPFCAVEVEGAAVQRYVSRAGEKLRGALDAFGIGVEGAAILDVGASTGGFTDCLLQAGAVSAVCVDCGHNQVVPTPCEHRIVVMRLFVCALRQEHEISCCFHLWLHLPS